MTTRDALFDHAIGKLREHTDARNAALLVDGDGRYVAARWFGESEPPTTSENDEAILALKSRHKPVDPHRYDSAIAGDLVLPMFVRGRLVGAVVCGPRSRGEAYAPDEVDASRNSHTESAPLLIRSSDGKPISARRRDRRGVTSAARRDRERRLAYRMQLCLKAFDCSAKRE